MDNKKIRSEIAKMHTSLVQEKYESLIKYAAECTTVYSDSSEFSPANEKSTEVVFVQEDSVSAIFNHSAGKTAVLNFASYKNPGGQFLNGSMAQEESLCHSSFLFNVLIQFGDYYAWNNCHKNNALYTNRALFIPEVYFKKENQVVACDVITCAAPNKQAALKYGRVTSEENSAALKSRIKFVLDIAAEQGVDTLILGAFGCGVFGQDNYEVATIFKQQLATHKHFKKVVFAIPDNKLSVFQKIISNV